MKTPSGISLSQSHYVEKVLKKFNSFDVAPARTPYDASISLCKNLGDSVSQEEYAKIIGSVMFLMNCTRPDIAYAVSRLHRSPFSVIVKQTIGVAKNNVYNGLAKSDADVAKITPKIWLCRYGTIKKPTDPVLLDNWEVVHCTLVPWIRNMIDPPLLPTIPYGEDASALWAALKARFSVVDATLIHSLKTQLNNCVQTKGMDVTTYFGKLQSLWYALIVHEPPFACKCGDCKCDIGTEAIKRLDNECLHQFFMGLDSTLYGNIRSQQFQFDPLPSLSRAYHVVLQEERLRAETTPSDTSDITVFAVSSSRPSVDWRAQREKERGERFQKLLCSYCETRGHKIVNCFFKTNKFHEWWGDRPRTLAEYRRYRAGSRGQNSGSGSAGGTSSGPGRDKDLTVHANAVMGPTAHSLLNSDRLSGMCNWILDTGASSHVTGTLSCLEDTKTISGRPVCLPNGQQVIATMTGSVYINDFLILHDVLYIPSLKCNLISISQLTLDSNLCFEFAKSTCLIQDRSSRTTIGAGELRDGLFWIGAGTRPTTLHSVSQQGSFDIWHQRLGHPSDKVVKSIPSLSSLNSNKDLICDICHYAKQHRHSFTSNNKHASDLFELIHCDLWGPYRVPSSCGALFF
ncbi:uncharacterized protein LOC141608664 [Silene latifolia]|uniref:uncharacterized protein LOC141608664 n=1 Tax=Silene latifolia TaxID=37657 RepID=UPI003D77030D